jgi:hypothetical protein
MGMIDKKAVSRLEKRLEKMGSRIKRLEDIIEDMLGKMQPKPGEWIPCYDRLSELGFWENVWKNIKDWFIR